MALCLHSAGVHTSTASRQTTINHVAPLHVAAVAFTANWRAEVVGEEREHLRTASAAGTCPFKPRYCCNTAGILHAPTQRCQTLRLCLCSSSHAAATRPWHTTGCA